MGIRVHKLGALAGRFRRLQGEPVPPPLAGDERGAAVAAVIAKPMLQRIRSVCDGPLVLVKGPEVARLYPGQARVYGDLDLLVPDPWAVQRELLAAGCVEVGEFFEDAHHLRPLKWPDLGLKVEVHKRPSWPKRLVPPSFEELFEAAGPASSGVEGVQTVSPAHHALILAAHGWKENPLGTRGYLQVHGASVGTPDGGVLLVGRGGSGKSTVALSSLGSELLYAGDDYVAVAVEPAPRVQSLYSSGKLEPYHAHGLLPHLLPLLSNAERLESEKAVLYVHEHFPEQTTSGFPLAAVFVPRVRASQRESRIVEASRAEAFAALAPSTILQLHTADSTAFAAMKKLVARVPCYGLEVGSDVAGIPGVIADFLARLSSG